MHTLRKALQTDAKHLAELATKTFCETFSSFNSEEDVALYCQTSYGADIQLKELQDPNVTTLLCVNNDTLIGYAQLAWKAAPSCVKANNPGEIQRLYVLKDWHGQGVAQMLMDASLQQLAERGTDRVWLGVWEHNPRAISFYKKYDFSEVGEQIFILGNDPQRDIVMARPI